MTYVSDAATLPIAATLRSASWSVVCQDDTLIRIAARPCHTVPPHQQVPSAWTRAMTRRLVRAEAHGAATPSPASWSHAPASQFAASVTGSDPPITNPKYRPPALATVAADPTRSRVASCSSASSVGAAGRVARPAR